MKSNQKSPAIMALLLTSVMIMTGGCACKTERKCDAKASKNVSKPYTGETEELQ